MEDRIYYLCSVYDFRESFSYFLVVFICPALQFFVIRFIVLSVSNMISLIDLLVFIW